MVFDSWNTTYDFDRKVLKQLFFMNLFMYINIENVQLFYQYLHLACYVIVSLTLLARYQIMKTDESIRIQFKLWCNSGCIHHLFEFHITKLNNYQKIIFFFVKSSFLLQLLANCWTSLTAINPTGTFLWIFILRKY